VFPKRSRRSTWFTLGFLVVCLVIFSGIAALGNAPERTGLAHSYDNLLRLHVLAHSDDPAEQTVKLAVRDALIREMATWSKPTDRGALEDALRENQTRLETLALQTLRQAGFEHDVRVEIGEFSFPEKRSNTVLLPAGDYRAVRVVIGDGAGQNWWCVLFPPLCFVDDAPSGTEVNVGESAPRAPAANRLVWTAEAAEAEAAVETETAPESESLTLASHLGGNDKKKVEWRLRLWESLSESVYAKALRDLIDVANGLSVDR